MKILCKIFFVMILLSNISFASDVFLHPSDAKVVMNHIPNFENINCPFTQTKTVPNSTVILKSGGDFSFKKEKGVIFYTKYPVKMTTSYDKNEQVNRIINNVINKNYVYLNKNFKFYFINSSTWELGLIPTNPQMKKYVKSLYIAGKKNIQTIEIKAVDGTVTRISFRVN